MTWGGSKWPHKYYSFKGSDKARMRSEQHLGILGNAGMAWRVCDIVVDETCYCGGFKLVTKEIQVRVTHTKIKSWGTAETARSKSYYLEMRTKLTVFKNSECFWKSKHPTDVDHVSEDQGNMPACLFSV